MEITKNPHANSKKIIIGIIGVSLMIIIAMILYMWAIHGLVLIRAFPPGYYSFYYFFIAWSGLVTWVVLNEQFNINLKHKCSICDSHNYLRDMYVSGEGTLLCYPCLYESSKPVRSNHGKYY